MPFSLKAAWILRITVGEPVERSAYTVPVTAPWMIPSGPSATASSSFGPGREVRISSLSRARALGLSAHLAPPSRCGFAASGRTSWTTRAWPAFMRFRAIGPPMFPSPTNPIRIQPASLPLRFVGRQLAQELAQLRSVDIDRLHDCGMPVTGGFPHQEILRLRSQLRRGLLDMAELDGHHLVPGHVDHQHSGFHSLELAVGVEAIVEPQLIDPVVRVENLCDLFRQQR